MSLGTLPSSGTGASASRAEAVSADGSVIVGSNRGPDTTQAFVWTEADGMVGLGVIGGDGATSELSAISDDGNRALGSSGVPFGGTGDGVRWEGGTELIALEGPTLGFSNLDMRAISADGSAGIGTGFTESGSVPVLWTPAGGIQRFDALVGTRRLRAISADGSVVAGETGVASDSKPFRWTESGGLELLDTFPTSLGNPQVYALSSDGSVAAGQDGTPKTGIDGVLWDADGAIHRLDDVLPSDYGIDLEGWIIGTVIDMTPDGRVLVGNGSNPDGVREVYRVELFPPTSDEPGVPESIGLAVAPNPTSGASRITLSLIASEDVHVAVVDVLGREVAVLHDGRLAAGNYGFALNAGGLATGMYTVRAETETGVSVHQMTVVR